MVAPNVSTTEYSQAIRIGDVNGMYALAIGSFERGPLTRAFIGGTPDMDSRFGKPRLGCTIAYYIAHSYLNVGKRLWLQRVVADDAAYGATSMGACFSNPLGFGDGLTTRFTGFLPFGRCHPHCVTLYIDDRKIGFDDGLGNIKGVGIAIGTVDYTNGFIDVTLVSPAPNKASVIGRWGFPHVPFAAGFIDPTRYEFNSRKLTQELAFTGVTYNDLCVPDRLWAPPLVVNNYAQSTVRVWDGQQLIAYADQSGVLIESGGQRLDLSAEHSVVYDTGRIKFKLNQNYTPANRLTVEFYSTKSEAGLVYADNPGSWADDYFWSVSAIDPIRRTYKITVSERDTRGYLVPVYEKEVSRMFQLDAIGGQMHWEQVLNGNNVWIRVLDNPNLEATEAIPSDNILHDSSTQMTNSQLSGGFNGSAVPISKYIQALKTFSNPEDIKIDLVIDTLCHPTFSLALANFCDPERGGRRCYGIHGVPMELEARSDAAEAIRDYRMYTLNLSTSFGTLVAGYGQLYDAYTGRYLWVPYTGFKAAAISYTTDTQEVWYPAAGWKRGKIPVAKSFRTYSPPERDLLYDADVNTVRFKPGRGIAFWGNKTLCGVRDARDRENVRLLLNLVEIEIENFLEEYMFDLNNSATRKDISNHIRDYLLNIQHRGGLYGSDVRCDENNNTGATIDQQILYVDYGLQPVRAIEYIKARATITPTGVKFDYSYN